MKKLLNGGSIVSALHNSYGGVKRTGEFNGIFDAYKNNKKRELYTSWHYNKKRILFIENNINKFRANRTAKPIVRPQGR